MTLLEFLETCERKRLEKMQSLVMIEKEKKPIYQAEQAGYFTCERCGTELRCTFVRQLKHRKRCPGRFLTESK